MLRDDRQLAINQVIQACLEAAHLHESGAALLDDDPGLARSLRALAGERSRIAAQLGDQLRRLGDLPQEPDADLEAAKELLLRVQVAVAGAKRDQIVRHAREAEAHLAETARAALEQDLPADTRATLEPLVRTPEPDVLGS